MNELKPCPFCGRQPRVIEQTPMEGDCQIFCVCDHEPMIIMGKGKIKEATMAWNKRIIEAQEIHTH